LFHRHARGLILTEQGELLMRTADEVMNRLESVKAELADSKGRPTGSLRVTTTVGLGSTWLATRVNEFLDLYPGISLELILHDDELDVGMREADVAVRLRAPTQPDLIQRKLFTVHFRVYASPTYVERFGQPKSVKDLDNHRLIVFGENAPEYLREMNWLVTAGLASGERRTPALSVNNVVAIKNAVASNVGIALLPDYIIKSDSELIAVMTDADIPSFDTYFVYPEELRNTARVTVFRDFLLANAKRWEF
jgi:DNA-binding transcriptional LysR family regulator